jgi:hypothetical protein
MPDTFCDIHRGGSHEDAPPAQGGCTSMRRPFRCLGLCAGAGAFLAAILALHAAEPPSPSAGANLAKLKNPDPEVRIEALRELQTSLDPRIPTAMLPLLADEGNSIRRLAARAIGSRWWQIPREELPAFQAKLKRNEATQLEDELNMVHRAQGLLARSYEGNMFARSADKRWVVYERHGLPCLIDTRTETEELLGWAQGGAECLTSSWGNGPASADVLWHHSKPFAAFSILLGRKESTVWVWRHRMPLRKFRAGDILKALGYGEGAIHFPGGVFVEVKEWNKDELRFEITFSTTKGEEWTDHTGVLGWDAVKDRLRVISKT